ncbi:MAG: GxxExxY protein [Candidatus Magasanikbacteria bacterium]|nr:GxxExxY protein [Candidatus Magasanikbacteria bacterium]
MFKEGSLTEGIIGAAMRLHRELGPGFKENIYQKGIILSPKEMNYDIEIEKPFIVYWKKIKIGNFRTDLIVNKKVIIETKAIAGKMPKIFQAQLISYLKASGIEVGLILNFGNPSLEFQRVVYYHK